MLPCGFTGRFMLCLTLLLVLMFVSVLFSIVITSLGEERAGLYASRAFLCFSFMSYFLSLSLPLGVKSWLRLVIVALPGHFIELSSDLYTILNGFDIIKLLISRRKAKGEMKSPGSSTNTILQD